VVVSVAVATAPSALNGAIATYSRTPRPPVGSITTTSLLAQPVLGFTATVRPSLAAAAAVVVVTVVLFAASNSDWRPK